MEPAVMHLEIIDRKPTCLLFVVLAFVLAGCGGGDRLEPETPNVIEVPPSGANEEALGGVIVQGIDPEGQFESELIGKEDPWELVALADRTIGNESIALRLAAIQQFIALQEFPAAETQTNFLVGSLLEPPQATRLNLYRGQIASALEQHDLALSYLQPLRANFSLAGADQLALFSTLANSQLALNRKVDALISLMRADALQAYDPQLFDQQLETQRRIINLIATLTPVEARLLQQSAPRSGLPANLVPGWIEFVPLLSMTEQQRLSPLSRWANAYATHPARGELLGEILRSEITLDRFNHIALLLPLTSPFGNAAQAFYDGFIDSFNSDDNVYKPTVSLHDIGDDPQLTAFYYRSAMNEGADFVVGPLGRTAVTGLLNGETLPLPTMVLGDIGVNQQADDLYGISLSPELEAEQVAERAFENGHRQAAIFRSDSTLGGRAARAFNDRWLALGGTVVTNKSFPGTIDDYSRIIQRLLEVNQSIARERVLSAQLGVNLEFTPRRRNDIDMLFFAGDAKQARLLVPQMRFFQAHNLPIYATSKIFNGKTNPAVDADLDDIVFGDMNWMLNFRYPDIVPVEATPSTIDPESTAEQTAATDEVGEEPVKPRPLAKSPYSFSPLDRLYALGLESYHLIPRLSSLKQDQQLRYNGEAFGASVRADGNIIRLLDWATFDKGEIQLLTPPAAPAQPELAE